MRAVRATVALLVLALAGCGGGGGGGASPPYTPPVTPAATPTPSPTSTASGAPAPAPTVGYLAGSGSSFSGTTRAGTSAVTVAAISEILIPRPTAPAFLPVGIRVDVGNGTQSAARQANVLAPATNSAPVSSPRVSLSAERAVNYEQLRVSMRSLRRSPTATVVAPAAAPASSRTFAVLTGSIGSSGNTYAQVATTLQQTTPHAYVYVDSTLGLSPALVTAIAADFENAYLSDTLHFGTPDYPNNAPFGPLNGTGTPCDSSGNKIAGANPIPVVIADSDPHTAVVVVSQSNAGNGEGGYFDPNNYFVQSFANCNRAVSNQTPMIVLVWPNSGNANANFETQEDMVRVTAHEFQHLINFVNHCILAPVCTPGDDPFMNEGLSMLAQDFAVHQLYPNLAYDVDEGLYFAGQFLQNPQSFNIGSFTGIDAGGSTPAFNCNGCYGGAYLFQRYLYNRFGGDAYTRAMTSAGGVAKANLFNVTGFDYGPLLGDFSIALMSSQNSLTASAAFTFALNPSGGYVDQFGKTFTLPGLGLAGTNALGTSTTYGSCQGCLFYVGIPTNGNTATVKVTDVSAAASLAAGVAQH